MNDTIDITNEELRRHPSYIAYVERTRAILTEGNKAWRFVDGNSRIDVAIIHDNKTYTSSIWTTALKEDIKKVAAMLMGAVDWQMSGVWRAIIQGVYLEKTSRYKDWPTLEATDVFWTARCRKLKHTLRGRWNACKRS